MLDPSTMVALFVFLVGIGGLAFSDWHDRRERKRDAAKGAESARSGS